ncbi:MULTISPECIES: four helix bundle protein [unclassified Microcystis]|uniref:four helix bundle protein n=1 Tax=unclassified Microcystis TaxID=2643300 RepID=UPI00119749C9|nr:MULTISPECIES: four helix bundle protein [unclassified Microcystis]MCA2937469.1 four helix bundle protein [Microcystis sp. M015S1]MCA2678759.1 four helix bundle protein [Microcystis sp. M043S2]MCA2852048.1 four helix bundle protein [Microcystis sp. M076S1]MCA2858237.1 four helix bundle protein [Microcystis sp. M005S1]MCA2920079.1 four helix bundle protein [Microcystis sp. M017S1]
MVQKPKKLLNTHEDIEVYQIAFNLAMEIFELSKKFPGSEKYSLIDQIRRSSRSVCANLAEAWRRRRYKGSFLLRLNDAEAEAAESQVWLKFAVKCQYLDIETGRKLYGQYNKVLGLIVIMTNNADKWLLKTPKSPKP